ncbi:MAG: hypothetical protein OEL55_03600, partial [Desulfobulbaceae bacterium]|nr:hypothetical protein [Desulfobulbaceae bacterium]
GNMLRLCGHITAIEKLSHIKSLQDDNREVCYHHKGLPTKTTVGQLAKEAVNQIEKQQGETK